MSMTDALIEQAKNRPDHPAIEDMRAGRVVSYAELPGLVDTAASNLLDVLRGPPYRPSSARAN